MDGRGSDDPGVTNAVASSDGNGDEWGIAFKFLVA